MGCSIDPIAGQPNTARCQLSQTPKRRSINIHIASLPRNPESISQGIDICLHSNHPDTPYPEGLSVSSLEALKETHHTKPSISPSTMPRRGDSRDESNPRKDGTQGESYSVPEQHYSETDSTSDDPAPPQGAAHHPNRRWRVCPQDPSFTLCNNPYISPERATLNTRTQGFPHGQSGISPDGFPSRSIEEGGVSGLFSQRESNQVSNDSAISDTPYSSSPSLGSADSSTSGVYDASIYTARAVPLLRLRLGQPGNERPGRLPSPGALDRIDNRIEVAERVWTEGPRRAVRQTQESRGRVDGTLTGGMETSLNPHSRDPDPRRAGQRGSAPCSRTHRARPHHTQGSATRYTGRAGEYTPAGGHHTRLQRVSSTPSESSIAETVSNVRQPTHPPHQPRHLEHGPDTASLPSSQRRAVAVAGPPGGPRRGHSYPAAAAGQEEQEAVPAVLAPGGLLGLGGSHPRPPPRVSRRQGRDCSDERESRRRQ